MHSTGAAFTLLPSRRAISYLVNANCYGREAMRNRPTLTSSDAQKMMAACKAEAAKHDFIVSIAIVDDGGYLLQLERADGAHLERPRIATLKATTAAICCSSSARMARISRAPGSPRSRRGRRRSAVNRRNTGNSASRSAKDS